MDNENSIFECMSQLCQIQDLDTAFGLEFFSGSQEMYIQTVRNMVRDIPSSVELLDQSLNADYTLKLFAVKTHGLKSALKQLGNLRLAAQAEALEKAAKSGDHVFCADKYGSFKDELLHFYHQVDAIIVLTSFAASQGAAGQADCMDEEDFRNRLTQAKTAAEAYDAVSAAAYLLPLAQCRFGTEADGLISKAMEALDHFAPRQAITYIKQLLNEPGTTA